MQKFVATEDDDVTEDISSTSLSLTPSALSPSPSPSSLSSSCPPAAAAAVAVPQGDERILIVVAMYGIGKEKVGEVAISQQEEYF